MEESYYAKNRDKVRERHRKYYQDNKERIKERRKAWYQANKDLRREQLREQSRASYKRNREQKLAYSRRLWQKLREAVIQAAGGPVCICCGFTDIRALQVDHVNGGGKKELKENPTYKNPRVFIKVIKENPTKYQVLCANCNFIKRYENNELYPQIKA